MSYDLKPCPFCGGKPTAVAGYAVCSGRDGSFRHTTFMLLIEEWNKRTGNVADQANASQWQPFETAPKDGRDFLAASPDLPEAVPVVWNTMDSAKKSHFVYARSLMPVRSPVCLTHWMPWPEPPKEHEND